MHVDAYFLKSVSPRIFIINFFLNLSPCKISHNDDVHDADYTYLIELRNPFFFFFNAPKNLILSCHIFLSVQRTDRSIILVPRVRGVQGLNNKGFNIMWLGIYKPLAHILWIGCSAFFEKY